MRSDLAAVATPIDGGPTEPAASRRFARAVSRSPRAVSRLQRAASRLHRRRSCSQYGRASPARLPCASHDASDRRTRFHETCRFAADSLTRLGRTVHHSRHRLTRLRRTSHRLPGAFPPSLVCSICATLRRHHEPSATQIMPPVLPVNACGCDALSRRTSVSTLRWFLPAERSQAFSEIMTARPRGFHASGKMLERSPTSNGGRDEQAYTKFFRKSSNPS